MSFKKKEVCYECGIILAKDEVALTKKLLGRKVEVFFCINCLAEFLECSPIDLQDKIQEFKEQGCTLFL